MIRRFATWWRTATPCASGSRRPRCAAPKASASVVLSLARATLVGDSAHAIGKVADGAVRQDGRNLSRLALPGTLAGELELTLRLANGTLLAARGHSLTLTVADDARFAQDLSC